MVMTHPREYPGLSVSGRMLQDNTRCQPKTHNHNNKHTRLPPAQQTDLRFFSTARTLADTTNCRPLHAVSSLHPSPLFIAAVQQQGCATPRPRWIPTSSFAGCALLRLSRLRFQLFGTSYYQFDLPPRPTLHRRSSHNPVTFLKD